MELEVGDEFGLWTLIADHYVETQDKVRKRRRRFLTCRCSCGAVKEVDYYNAVKGRSRGCHTCTSGMRSHGKSGTDLYHIWEAMKQRCTNPNHKHYKDYGGRGIVMCGEWLNHPAVFISWAESNGYEKGLQIDREDNEEGYTKSNCRFVTQQVNLLNTRTLSKSNTLGFRGVTKIKNRTNTLYLANLRYESVEYRLGRYPEPQTAALARDLFCVRFGIPLPLNDKTLRHADEFRQPTKDDVNEWRLFTEDDLLIIESNK